MQLQENFHTNTLPSLEMWFVLRKRQAEQITMYPSEAWLSCECGGNAQWSDSF